MSEISGFFIVLNVVKIHQFVGMDLVSKMLTTQGEIILSENIKTINGQLKIIIMDGAFSESLLMMIYIILFGVINVLMKNHL